MTDPAPPNPPKRPVGRPKGSKNGPDAGKNGRPVGRPRKNPPNEQRGDGTADSTSSASGGSAVASRGRSKTIEATVVQRPLRLAGSSRSSRSVSLHQRGRTTAGRDDSRARSNEAAAAVAAPAAGSRPASREAVPAAVESGDTPRRSPSVVTSAGASAQPHDEQQCDTARGTTGRDETETAEPDVASAPPVVATPPEAATSAPEQQSSQQPVVPQDGQGPVRPSTTPEDNEPEMLPRDIQGDETAAEAVSLQRRPAPGSGDSSRGRSITLERDFEDGEEAADDIEYGVDDEGEFRAVPDDDDEDDGAGAASASASGTAAPTDVPNISLPSGAPSGASSAKTKKSRSGLPTWLPKEYREICATLRTEMERSPRGWPACYEAGSFYYTAGKNPFFVSLTRSQLDPMMFWRPRYFVWFPHLFQRIPCPECVAAGRRMVRAGIPTLSPYTTPKGPRHVYDVTDHVYIIGQRYRCQHDKCKKTYQSWSPAVLNAIPPALAAQFTFHLSYRSGLTDDLAALLRSNFQRGTGPVPFAQMIRTFHICRWEQLLQQFLEMVYSRADAVSVGLIALHETFGEWNDMTKYAGSAPSSSYCSAFYVNFMRQHGPLMDKRMSMLTGRAMCLDLSFKVIKHLGKVDGVPIFGSLLSVVNEFGECRAMTLTMTKAHDQFMPTLAEIPRSLELY